MSARATKREALGMRLVELVGWKFEPAQDYELQDATGNWFLVLKVPGSSIYKCAIGEVSGVVAKDQVTTFTCKDPAGKSYDGKVARGITTFKRRR
jgi:hypothetical protein